MDQSRSAPYQEDLIRLKIELELEGRVIGETLPQSHDPVDPEPLLLISRSATGRRLYFRSDVPDDLRQQLHALDDDGLNDADTIRTALADVATVTKITHLCWYVVERTPDTSEFPDVTRQDGRFVVLVDEAVAAQAWADQTNELAEEVAVATVTAHRGRGYGRQVVAAWMHSVQTQGKVGFYSHLAANDASRALARSAGVIWLVDEIEYIHMR